MFGTHAAKQQTSSAAVAGHSVDKRRRANFARNRFGDNPIRHAMFLQQTIGNQSTTRLLAQLDHPKIGSRGDTERETNDTAVAAKLFGEARLPGLISGQPVDSRGHETRTAADPAAPAPGSVGNEVSGLGGQPLDAGTRSLMGNRFGRDFGEVRIHTGERAATSAAAITAKAYTVGRDIVFGRGRYAPGTAAGQELLAHELTHVVQQSQPEACGSGSGAEAEAHAVASAAAAGQHVQVHTGGAGIQCDADEGARERVESLQERIAAIDAELNTPGALTREYVDERMIQRERLSHELATVQPATPEQLEAVLTPADVQRRKEQTYETYVNLPTGLQQDLQKMGIKPPEKPVYWLSGKLPSPLLQGFVERVARKADEENISLGDAAKRVEREHQQPTPRVSTDQKTSRHQLNRQLMASGLKPLPDPDRKPTEWEKAVIEGNPEASRSWRAVINPDTGDVVGYERGSTGPGGFYERRNVRGEITHQREGPMTEDATFLTRPDRELTPFERQHVFVEKEGRKNPEAYQAIYNKQTGGLIGYKHQSGGITRTYNTKGVVVDVHELPLEESPIQAGDILGVASLARAPLKYGIRKGGAWLGRRFARKAGEELVEQGERRLLEGGSEEVLQKFGGTEAEQVGREAAALGDTEAREVNEISGRGVESLAEARPAEATVVEGSEGAGSEAFEQLGEAGGAGGEPVALSGTEAAQTGAKQIGEAEAFFSPAPANVGEAAFKARMKRDVKNVMRAQRRNELAREYHQGTVGPGLEAAALRTAPTTTADLNIINKAFPGLDLTSRAGFTQVKFFTSKDFKVLMRRYLDELQVLRGLRDPKGLNKIGQAANELATNRKAIQAAGSWPTGLARDATAEQIENFINKEGVLAIPNELVRPVRKALAAAVRKALRDNNLEAWGLREGPGLGKAVRRLAKRVQPAGLTSKEILDLNAEVLQELPAKP
jgi:hypothetical protein